MNTTEFTPLTAAEQLALLRDMCLDEANRANALKYHYRDMPNTWNRLDERGQTLAGLAEWIELAQNNARI